MSVKAVAGSLTWQTVAWFRLRKQGTGTFLNNFVLRMYCSGRRSWRYDLFGSIRGKGREEEGEGSLWTESSEGEEEGEKEWRRGARREMKKAEMDAAENSVRIDGDDSEELRSVFSGSESDKCVWTGGEEDSEGDAPTEPFPNEASDRHLDKLFEVTQKGKGRKYKSYSEALKAAEEDTDGEEAEDMTPGKQARKAAVERALRKLRKGPDGRYVNVWEVMSDLDILIGAFDNLVSGPEYEEMRKGGPKKLDIDFFKDVQKKMRDPKYNFSPEYKLKPRSRFVSKAKWQKTESRRRKAARR